MMRANGGGDRLILRSAAGRPDRLGPELRSWDHETGATVVVVVDIAEVIGAGNRTVCATFDRPRHE